MLINPKKLRFIDEYLLNGGNAYAAAVSAGYAPNSARKTADRMLADPLVQETVQNRLAKERMKYGITKDRLIQELTCIALSDPKDMYNADGSLMRIADMPEHARRAIGGIRMQFNKAGAAVPEILLRDKIAAITTIAKMLGYNEPDKINVSGQIAQLPEGLTAEKVTQLAGLSAPQTFIEDVIEDSDDVQVGDEA